MSFLIPLAIALAAVAAFAVLVVGLTSAPWPVLLLLIVLVLISSQRLMAPIHKSALQTADAPPSPDADPQAKEAKPQEDQVLTYRGKQYKYAPMTFGVSREVEEVEYSGKYRGVPWKSPRKKKSTEDSN